MAATSSDPVEADIITLPNEMDNALLLNLSDDTIQNNGCVNTTNWSKLNLLIVESIFTYLVVIKTKNSVFYAFFALPIPEFTLV